MASIFSRADSPTVSGLASLPLGSSKHSGLVSTGEDLSHCCVKFSSSCIVSAQSKKIRKYQVLYPSAYGIKNRIRWGERRLYLKVEFPSDLELRNEIKLFPANIWILKFWWRKLWEKKNLKNQMLAGNNLNLFLNSRSEEILTLAEVRFSVIYFSAINQI